MYKLLVADDENIIRKGIVETLRKSVEYFELYQEKQPTVIFLAKNTVDNREKFFAKNPFGIWIAKNYNVECMKETDSLCIIRKK